jgi:hypothetical protein
MNTFHACPDCGTTIRNGSKCGCNRTSGRYVPPAEVIPCEQIGCLEPAIVRIKDGHILRTMCRTHYDQHFQREASDYAHSVGLDTTETKKSYHETLLRAIGCRPQSKEWAYSLKSDYLDGADLERIQIVMASGALNEVWQQIGGERLCSAVVDAS